VQGDKRIALCGQDNSSKHPFANCIHNLLILTHPSIQHFCHSKDIGLIKKW
jgi:hypothetical protein